MTRNGIESSDKVFEEKILMRSEFHNSEITQRALSRFTPGISFLQLVVVYNVLTHSVLLTDEANTPDKC